WPQVALAARQKTVAHRLAPEPARGPARAWRHGRHGAIAGRHNAVGWAHANAAPRCRGHRGLLPAGPGVGAWASECTARDPLVCDCLYRTGAGCASRLGADDVCAAVTFVFAGELGAPQYADPPAGGYDAVHCRLHCRKRARRLAGDPAWPIRSGYGP